MSKVVRSEQSPLGDKGIELESNLEDEEILAAPSMFTQLLVNLLQNGLAAVKRIVELHGWTLEIHSVVDWGTTVVVTGSKS